MTGTDFRLNAVVIDPNSGTRTALKELLHNEPRFNKYVYQSVFVYSTPLEAIPKITDGEGVDVIFISDRIPFEEIRRFIRAAQEMEGDSGVAYIVVLDATDQRRVAVSEGLAYGADGFLLVPSSISCLREITEIAHRIKLEAHSRRVKIALRLLVETLIDEIEMRARKLYYHDEVLGYGRQLKSAVRRLLGSDVNMFFSYIDILEEALKRMPPLVFSAEYLGSSRRVRQMYQ